MGNLINCVLEADEEFLCMDFHFTLRDGGMRATFQLLHMVLEVSIYLRHHSRLNDSFFEFILMWNRSP